MKKIIIIIFIILCAAYVFIAKFNASAYQVMVGLNLIHPCYKPNNDLVDIFKQQGFDYEKMDKEIVEKALKKLLTKVDITDQDSKIPPITHHIYFVKDNNTKALLDFYIKKMQANFDKLNAESDNWQHFLWSNDHSIFPEHIKQIKGVKLKNISELKDHPLFSKLSDSIKKGNENTGYFMEASDIFRLMLLQKFGGIYTDMDYELYQTHSLMEFMKRFDFIAGRELPRKLSYYGNSFLVSKPNHPIINDAISRLERTDLLNYMKYPCNMYDKLYFNSPPLLTISYFAKNNIDGNNDMILPAWMVLNVDFARYKNGDCTYVKINKEGFEENDKKLFQLMKEYPSKVEMKDGSSEGKDNIYYSYKHRDGFEIIGADMFCATWVEKKASRKYYWRFLDEK
ncbi:MAG: glycosyltransferase [Pseudomonadota bacterium]